MKLFAAGMVALAMVGAAQTDKTLGAGGTLAQATPVAPSVTTLRHYADKTIRIDGVATAVCEEMGCWMAVADSTKKHAPTIRLKVEDGGAIVFPMSAKGRRVSAEGTFEAIGGADAHARDAAAEHAKQG